MTIAGTLARPRALDRLLPSDRLFWAALALVGVIVPPWEHARSVEITGMPQAMAIVAVLLALRAAYAIMRPGAHMVHTLLENGAGVIAYTAVVAPVSYLCARTSRPLFNDWFLAADGWLGYDWHAWADFENGSPAISTVLQLAYASLLPQMVLVLTILPFIGNGRRGFSLIRGSLIAVIVACAGSYAMPAAMMPQAVNTEWYVHWSQLRSTAPFTTALSQAEGIITFPSFHASMAILLLYAVRGLGVVTMVFGTLELLMLVSTTTYGTHYFSDVLAGILVAVLAIWMTSVLNRRFPIGPPET